MAHEDAAALALLSAQLATVPHAAGLEGCCLLTRQPGGANGFLAV